MILLPIGRDDAEIRRHAWVSYAIIALNILVFVGIETAERRTMAKIDREWQEAWTYISRRPYLQVPPAMAELLQDAPKRYLDQRRQMAQPPPAPVMRREQVTFNVIAGEAVAAYHGLPRVRFGYIPAEGGFGRLVSSMFVHAGFFHLLFNLLFFFVSGPFIEDVFGRPLFAALYLLGGFAAALTYAVKHPTSVIPLVGASGAIAAVMGAYLVRFLRSKVEFLFVPLILRPTLHFRFFLPAFVVLPLWLLKQFLEMRNEGSSGGVAFSAHVGGFVFGAAVALIVKLTRFEQNFVDPAVAKETTWALDERTLRAMTARDQGDYATAKRELGSVLREKPTDIDALRTAVDVAQLSEDAAMLDTCAVRLLNRYTEEKNNDLAEELIHELIAERAHIPKFLGRAAVFAERSGKRDWALSLYERVLAADPNGPGAVPSLVKIGTLLRLGGDFARARETFARARAHPACTAEWAPAIDAKIAQIPSS
jgi:membrane associated rhomboid family serine protease